MNDERALLQPGMNRLSGRNDRGEKSKVAQVMRQSKTLYFQIYRLWFFFVLLVVFWISWRMNNENSSCGFLGTAKKRRRVQK